MYLRGWKNNNDGSIVALLHVFFNVGKCTTVDVDRRDDNEWRHNKLDGVFVVFSASRFFFKEGDMIKKLILYG